MKVIVIGASGATGRAVGEGLSQRHDAICVGRTQGDYQVDITLQGDVGALFTQTGEVNAIISITSNLYFGPLNTMTNRQFNLGLQNRLLGQIRLALVRQRFLCDGGSIALANGIVAQEFIVQGIDATTVNAGLEGFVRVAACKLPRGIRTNLISPTVSGESPAAYDDLFSGFTNVPAVTVAQAYRHSTEGVQTGRIYPVGYQPVPARRGRRLHQAVIAGTPMADYLRPKN